jgi:hypothetical protein
MPEAKLLSGKETGEFSVSNVRPEFRTDLPLALSSLALILVLLTGSRLGSGSPALGMAPALSRRAPQSVHRLAFSIRPPPQRH